MYDPTGWDDSFSPELQRNWDNYVRELSTLAHVRILRGILPGRVAQTKVHGFCDASEASYAAKTSKIALGPPFGVEAYHCSSLLDKAGSVNIFRESVKNVKRRHPISLPKRDPIVDLIIRYHHLKKSHAGAHTLISNTSVEFLNNSCATRSAKYPISLHSVLAIKTNNFLTHDGRLSKRSGFCGSLISTVGVGHEFSKQGITWIFDPPSCPHRVRLFKAAFKSAQIHLRRVIWEEKLTFEELSTVFFFYEIEAGYSNSGRRHCQCRCFTFQIVVLLPMPNRPERFYLFYRAHPKKKSRPLIFSTLAIIASNAIFRSATNLGTFKLTYTDNALISCARHGMASTTFVSDTKKINIVPPPYLKSVKIHFRYFENGFPLRYYEQQDGRTAYIVEPPAIIIEATSSLRCRLCPLPLEVANVAKVMCVQKLRLRVSKEPGFYAQSSEFACPKSPGSVGLRTPGSVRKNPDFDCPRNSSVGVVERPCIAQDGNGWTVNGLIVTDVAF
ncbi:hypothetical protein EVAR_1024_1 [Eumeta japonica]|uniref:Uncharacterized protein n=1 Tax=Eumeta variegata TaxID=151549 RepID=A0A4C1SEB4_EUMVA|nr:hypothetical protein EVAR_1024_1 [Eumeta japonica]